MQILPPLTLFEKMSRRVRLSALFFERTSRTVRLSALGHQTDGYSVDSLFTSGILDFFTTSEEFTLGLQLTAAEKFHRLLR